MPLRRKKKSAPPPDEESSSDDDSSSDDSSSGGGDSSSDSGSGSDSDGSDDSGEGEGDAGAADDDGEYGEGLDDDGEGGDGQASEGTYDPLSDALDALIDSVVDYDDPSECWDLVREWLQVHSMEETTEAMELRGEFDTTALHVACRNRPPADVVEVMLMAAPDMIFWADSFGWLPLPNMDAHSLLVNVHRCFDCVTFLRSLIQIIQMHYACANGTEIEVVKLLLDAYPDSKLTTDKRGRTPLHFALGNVENPPTSELVKLLAGKTGESVKWPDENEMLPIHYACAYGASMDVLTELIGAWEESMQKTDAKGRTPLHFAMGNADRENSPRVVQMLLDLSPGGMDQVDAEKNLPLNLLGTKAEGVEEDDEEAQKLFGQCLDIYLKAKVSETRQRLDQLGPTSNEVGADEYASAQPHRCRQDPPRCLPLIGACEESMQKTDAKGQTPLHFAKGNADRENSPRVVQILLDLSLGGMDQVGAEKNLPLNLLGTKTEGVEEDDEEARKLFGQCFGIYLKAKASNHGRRWSEGSGWEHVKDLGGGEKEVCSSKSTVVAPSPSCPSTARSSPRPRPTRSPPWTTTHPETTRAAGGGGRLVQRQWERFQRLGRQRGRGGAGAADDVGEYGDYGEGLNDDGEGDDGRASEGTYDPLSGVLDTLIDSIVDYDDPLEC
ncbi:hypothetical protein ACHAWF_014307 [Thalassiosira exigua]